MKTGYSFGSLVSFVEVLDATTVKITGDQTIAGLKTFSSNPITSASQGSGGGYLTRKDYVDGKLALKAPLDSPALTGIPTAPTAAVNTDTTQLATTAFVQNALATLVPVEASSANPLMNGVAAAGTSNKYSRGDHVHPTDTSRASLYSPAFSGTPTAPTATAGTDTSQIATTAFVTASITAQLGTATPLMDGTAAVGTSTLLSRQDHKHPSDTSRAPLSSPALTGTPTAPTATAGTNTTQLATTAFVQSALATIVPVEASTDSPVMNGTATAGTSIKYSRGDHVHPTDTSRAPLASPTFTGTPAAPTATAGTNTTQLATTAFVTAANAAQVGTDTPLMDGTAAVGVSTLLSRQDHIHPTDTTRAPLASPAFTGVPTAPTPAQFSADTKIATMEAVQRALGSYRNYTLITTSTTLNASHVGHVLNISSGGITLTLPLPSSLGITSLMGQCITVHAATNACNINAASNVTLMDSLNTTITNLTIPQGCAAQLVVLTANLWRVTIMSGMGVTPTVGDSSTKLATTEFVANTKAAMLSTVTPLMDGVGAVGNDAVCARQDHVHPTDTSRAPLASPTFTGTPAAPTAAAGTNTTQLATTAFVTVAIYNKCSDVTPLMNGTAAIGTSTKFTREDHVHPSDTSKLGLGTATPLMSGTAAVGTSTLGARQDHIHPTDTSRAPLASPTFTGTPAGPTASQGTNSTQLATTAFVNSAISLRTTYTTLYSKNPGETTVTVTIPSGYRSITVVMCEASSTQCATGDIPYPLMTMFASRYLSIDYGDNADWGVTYTLTGTSLQLVAGNRGAIYGVYANR